MCVDKEKLTRDLEDYYGTAAFGGMPAAFSDLFSVRELSTGQLLQQAENNGFDLNKYTSNTSKNWWE